MCKRVRGVLTIWLRAASNICSTIQAGRSLLSIDAYRDGVAQPAAGQLLVGSTRGEVDLFF